MNKPTTDMAITFLAKIPMIVQTLYSIKGLKTWETREGGGFQFKLLRDGKPVATVTNEGNGGMFRYGWINPKPATVHALSYDDKELVFQGDAEEAALWDVCKALPPDKGDRWNTDMLMEELVTQYEVEKEVKRMLKMPTIVIEGAVLQFKKAPLNDALRHHVRKTYDGAIVLNDLPFTDAVAAYRAVTSVR